MNPSVRSLIITGLAVTALTLSGCYRAPVVPPLGGAYTNISAPLSTSTSGSDMGSKRGRAESVSLLGLVAYGDCSVGRAAQRGGISQVKHVDYEFFNLLGIYQRFTTVAHGD
jgi:hypothetical protein